MGTKEMGIGVLFILQKIGYGTFSSKKGEVGKIEEKSCLGRVTYTNLSVYLSKKHYNPRYMSNKF